MWVLAELKLLWRVLLGQIRANDYIGPDRQRQTIPNDISLQLDFPVAISTPYEKLLYSLRREGEQCYCNLRVLTGLSESEIRPALRQLLEEKRVRKTVLPSPPLPGVTDEMSRFLLVS